MKETEKKDKTIRETDEKTGGHLVLFVRRNAVYITVFLIGAAFLLAAGSFDWDRINSYTMSPNATTGLKNIYTRMLVGQIN